MFSVCQQEDVLVWLFTKIKDARDELNTKPFQLIFDLTAHIDSNATAIMSLINDIDSNAVAIASLTNSVDSNTTAIMSLTDRITIAESKIDTLTASQDVLTRRTTVLYLCLITIHCWSCNYICDVDGILSV